MNQLLPGKYSERQMAIIEKFGPRFAIGAVVLYLGDTANKYVIYERERLEQLGVPITLTINYPILSSTTEPGTNSISLGLEYHIEL